MPHSSRPKGRPKTTVVALIFLVAAAYYAYKYYVLEKLARKLNEHHRQTEKELQETKTALREQVHVNYEL